jgi:ferric-dicitrate binding protein FerR (iron transport regulator)
MTDRSEERPVPPGEGESPIAKELRDLPRPRPRAEFRDRLRGEFASGRIEAPSPRPVGDRPGRTGWLRGFGLAAAAVLLLAVGWNMLRGPAESRTPRWSPHLPGTRSVTIRLAERTLVLPADAGAFAAALDAGLEFAVDDTMAFDLSLGRLLSVQIAPGSGVRLPVPDAGTDRLTGRLSAGEVRVTTGPDFPGHRLAWSTSGAEVVVSGTTFAVIRGGDSTCVCVYEGRLEIRPLGGEAAPLDAGLRRILTDGAAHGRTEPITAMETMKLRMFRDAARERERPLDDHR